MAKEVEINVFFAAVKPLIAQEEGLAPFFERQAIAGTVNSVAGIEFATKLFGTGMDAVDAYRASQAKKVAP